MLFCFLLTCGYRKSRLLFLWQVIKGAQNKDIVRLRALCDLSEGNVWVEIQLLRLAALELGAAVYVIVLK
jgi:hypothetical protein